MKISTIQTFNYLRSYGYDLKKVAKLQSSDRKIYLFYHTQAYPVTGFDQPNNHYAYLQLQNKIPPNALDYDEFLNVEEIEVYKVEDNGNAVENKKKPSIRKRNSNLVIENDFFNFMLNHEYYPGGPLENYWKN